MVALSGNGSNPHHYTFLTGDIRQKLFIEGSLGELDFLYSCIVCVDIQIAFMKELERLIATPQ